MKISYQNKRKKNREELKSEKNPKSARERERELTGELIKTKLFEGLGRHYEFVIHIHLTTKKSNSLQKKDKPLTLMTSGWLAGWLSFSLLTSPFSPPPPSLRRGRSVFLLFSNFIIYWAGPFTLLSIQVPTQIQVAHPLTVQDSPAQ